MFNFVFFCVGTLVAPQIQKTANGFEKSLIFQLIFLLKYIQTFFLWGLYLKFYYFGGPLDFEMPNFAPCFGILVVRQSQCAFINKRSFFQANVLLLMKDFFLQTHTSPKILVSTCHSFTKLRMKEFPVLEECFSLTKTIDHVLGFEPW